MTTTARFTSELLRDYCLAALANAGELVAEATLLHKHGHFARAYFLAVASIEETGKGYLAFDAQGRNLSDAGVASRLRQLFDDHRQKISSAFIAWLTASPNVQEAVRAAIDLMVDLRHGREPSMYTDVNADSSGIQIPVAAIREKAAFDCIRLATDCLFHTQRHVAKNALEPRTRAQDQLFAMKPGQFQKLTRTEDFWWYYASEVEAGRHDFAEAAVAYQETYAKTGMSFRTSDTGSDI